VPHFKRILLKVSGETFGRDGIESERVDLLAAQISVLSQNYEVATVNGAGNIWRHRDNLNTKLSRVESDFKGMEGTLQNAAALQRALEKLGVRSEVNSAFDFPVKERIFKFQRLLSEQTVVLCAGGTGHPFFTTDSGAAVCALELGCDVLLKATTVDGVYDSDPDKNPSAAKYDEVTYDECLALDLKVMDGAAIALCRDNKLPLIVFEFGPEGNIEKALQGVIGTRVVA
jgi:uridylate kinase